MRVARKKAQQAKLRRRRDEEGLDWRYVAAVGAVLLTALIAVVRVEPEEDYFRELVREGALFLARPHDLSRLGSTCLLLRRWLPGVLLPAVDVFFRVDMLLARQGSMEVQEELGVGALLTFVPHTSSLTPSAVSEPELRKALAGFVVAAEEGASADVGELAAEKRRRAAVVATALGIVAEARLAELRQSSGKSKFAPWLRRLPRSLRFSTAFTADQRAALAGTAANAPLQEHDHLLEDLHEAAASLPYFSSRPVTEEEATWSLALVTRYGLPNAAGDVLMLVPGLLDGVQPHWDPTRCSELARNVAPTGKLPGWALVAGRSMKPADAVYLCTGRASNAHTLAVWGTVIADNPHGAILSRGGAAQAQFEAARVDAGRAGCQAEEVPLALQHNESAILTQGNVICSSLMWMDSIGDALEAMSSGYFAAWPRNATAQKRWLAAEAGLYNGLGSGCNRSLEVVLGGADDEVLERLRVAADGGEEISKLVLRVRNADVALYTQCERWAAERAQALEAVLLNGTHVT